MSKYDLEFKKMIVDMYLSGTSVTKLVADYEISKASVYTWRDELNPSPVEQKTDDLKQGAEFRQMQKELARLREENEILKKCVTIFSKK